MSDQDARGGSSSIAVTDNAAGEVDLTGVLGGVLGRDNRAVGFVIARFPKLLVDRKLNPVDAKIGFGVQNLYSDRSENLDMLTISVTPTKEFLARIGWDSQNRGELTFQADAALGGANGQVQQITSKIADLRAVNRGSVVTDLSAVFTAEDIERLGVSFIRSKQKQLDPAKVDRKAFHLRISSFSMTDNQ